MKKEVKITADIPIFLASDDNYAPFAAAAMASICDNTREAVEFLVLDGGISAAARANIEKLSGKFANFHVEFIPVDTSPFKDFTLGISYISESAYSRFIIGRLCPKIPRAIYLDVDIIAMGNIAELWAQDLGGHIIGAVRDCNAGASPVEKILERRQNNIIGVPLEHKYFNSGVLLIDLEKWREAGVEDSLFEIERGTRGKIKCQDQEILNILFSRLGYAEISPRFNWTNRYSFADGPSAPGGTVIRHFTTAAKPWLTKTYLTGGKELDNHGDFWHYAGIAGIDEEFCKWKK